VFGGKATCRRGEWHIAWHSQCMRLVSVVRVKPDPADAKVRQTGNERADQSKRGGNP
jgi:hypothetical protein